MPTHCVFGTEQAWPPGAVEHVPKLGLFNGQPGETLLIAKFVETFPNEHYQSLLL